MTIRVLDLKAGMAPITVGRKPDFARLRRGRFCGVPQTDRQGAPKRSDGGLGARSALLRIRPDRDGFEPSVAVPVRAAATTEYRLLPQELPPPGSVEQRP
jgi:hypothetical protein